MAKRKTIGLALGSGAVRGFAHIGVIKTLVKHNIPIDYISGSSIGSWVGAYYSLYQDIEKLEEFTIGKRKEKFLSFLEPTLSGGIVKGERLQTMLDGWLGRASFSDLKIPLDTVATDLISGKQVIFNQGNLALAIRASMAVPGVFRPVKFGKMLLVDGGISNPVPDDLVKNMGADIVIAVNLDNRDNFKYIEKRLDFAAVAVRTIEIMRQNLADYSIQYSDIIIKPDLAKYSSWAKYFLSGQGRQIVSIGEKETEKIIPQLKKLIA